MIRFDWHDCFIKKVKKNMSDCLFCKIIQGDIPADRIYEDEQVLAFLDIHPVNTGHTLFIPKQHADNLLETPDENLAHLMQIVKKIAPSILRAVQAEGFNLGVNTGSIAGQVIFHTHIHVMPRFSKDGHDMWHEKEIGDLTNIAERIRKEIQK